jgi:hypothetical protein
MPALRFLADESCDFAVVRALRAAGFDVLAINEFMNRSMVFSTRSAAHSPAPSTKVVQQAVAPKKKSNSAQFDFPSSNHLP